MTPASRASPHYCQQAKTSSREEGGPPLALLAVSQVAEGEGEEEEGGRWSLVFMGSGWDRLNLEGLGLPVEAEAQDNVFPILLTGLSFVAYCRPVPLTTLSLSLCLYVFLKGLVTFDLTLFSLPSFLFKWVFAWLQMFYVWKSLLKSGTATEEEKIVLRINFKSQNEKLSSVRQFFLSTLSRLCRGDRAVVFHTPESSVRAQHHFQLFNKRPRSYNAKNGTPP